MLHLSRKQGEAVVIDGQVEVRVLEIRGKAVKLGITSPSHISVLRQEIHASILAENTAAAELDVTLFEEIFGKKPTEDR
jgi:carbon storage regulator